MNMEQTFTVLRREQLLIDHAPHSVQFQDLTDSLLRVCSAAAVIPALSALEIRLYSTLALLHDVGKRAIPPEILNKPDSLTKEEFEVMKTHTTQGCDLLERVSELRECEAFPAICDVCHHHHERWDGTGYPDRLAGENITPWVYVVGLTDAFGALVHPRVYKPAFTQPARPGRWMMMTRTLRMWWRRKRRPGTSIPSPITGRVTLPIRCST